jgi:tetratricopeptide (TPR) repeat protein
MERSCDCLEGESLDVIIDGIRSQAGGSARLKSMGIAMIYVDNKCGDKAIEEIQGLIQSGDEAADSYFYLGEAYVAVGKSEQARKCYQIAELKTLQTLAFIKAALAKVEIDTHQASTLSDENQQVLNSLDEKTLKYLKELEGESQESLQLTTLLEEVRLIVLPNTQPLALAIADRCNCSTDGGVTKNGKIKPNGCINNNCVAD